MQILPSAKSFLCKTQLLPMCGSLMQALKEAINQASKQAIKRSPNLAVTQAMNCQLSLQGTRYKYNRLVVKAGKGASVTASHIEFQRTLRTALGINGIWLSIAHRPEVHQKIPVCWAFVQGAAYHQFWLLLMLMLCIFTTLWPVSRGFHHSCTLFFVYFQFGHFFSH